MPSLLDQLDDVKVDGSTTVGRLLLKAGVPDSPCVTRVASLPRRDTKQDFSRMNETVSAMLRRPGSRARLLNVQVEALIEMAAQQGMLGPIPAGEGKTLITLLAQRALDVPGTCVLLVPSGLVGKTEREFDVYLREWDLGPHERPIVLGYNKVSTVKGAESLEEKQPTVIVADEVHYLKKLTSARTIRVSNYMEAHPNTRFVGLSGTIVDNSLLDFWHLALWALRHKAPVPLQRSEAERWARAVDVKAKMPMALGALTCLGDYAQRVRETPGVVCGPPSDLRCSLRISYDRFELPKDIKDAITRVSASRQSLSGLELTDELVAMTNSTLRQGFYYEYEEEPPKEWARARRRWVSFVNACIEARLEGCDSDARVALKYGRSTDEGKEWFAIKGTFKPKTVTRWLDRTIIPQLVERAGKNCLIWVGHRAVREVLTCKFFGDEGFADDGQYVEDAEGTIALSIKANATGRNLQFKWASNYLIHVPSKGIILEQLLARTHRPLQPADEVTARIYAPSRAIDERVKNAIEEARFQMGFDGRKKRLLIADFE